MTTNDKKLAVVRGKPKSIIHPFRQYFTVEQQNSLPLQGNIKLYCTAFLTVVEGVIACNAGTVSLSSLAIMNQLVDRNFWLTAKPITVCIPLPIVLVNLDANRDVEAPRERPIGTMYPTRPATSQSPKIQPATIQPPTIQPETTQSAIQPKTAEPATAQQAKATLQKTQLKKKAALMKPSVPEAGVELLNQVRFEGFAGEWRALDLIYEAEQKLKESQTWNSETSKRVRFEYSSSGWRALDPECRPSREWILNFRSWLIRDVL